MKGANTISATFVFLSMNKDHRRAIHREIKVIPRVGDRIRITDYSPLEFITESVTHFVSDVSDHSVQICLIPEEET